MARLVNIVNPDSLAGTLDAANEAFVYGRSLSKSQREQAARWIAGRQDRPGSYRGVMFAPTEDDFKQGIRLFTGERLRTRAGMAHVLGEEACRALILLDAPVSAARDALNRASAGMTAILQKTAGGYTWRERPGEYCCGRCTAALWRHLAVGGLSDADPERWLVAGMKVLTSHRDGDGRWRRFPFYYTLLALSEIDLPSAIKEMRYAAPVCERHLKQSPKDEAIVRRRRLVAERILARL